MKLRGLALLCLCSLAGACGGGQPQNRVTDILQMRSAASIEQGLTALVNSDSGSRRQLDKELKAAGFRLVSDEDRCDVYSYEEDHDTQAPLEHVLSVRLEWCSDETRVRAWYTGL